MLHWMMVGAAICLGWKGIEIIGAIISAIFTDPEDSPYWIPPPL